MAPPLGFNDPYDCALSVRINEISDEDSKKIAAHYANKGGLWEAGLLRMLSRSANSNIYRAVQSAIGKNEQDFLKLRGVSCFSEKNDDLLMWGHYGDGYRGFCMGFNTQDDLFKKAREVRYVEQIPDIDIVSLLIKEDINHLELLYCTKSTKWQYEMSGVLFMKKSELYLDIPPKR